MSRAGNALLRGVDAEALSQTLTACAPLTSSPSSGCSPSRTASQAPLYLVDDELPELAEINRHAGAALAGRVAELGGAITGDPTQIAERS
jgi:hypothetical protein